MYSLIALGLFVLAILLHVLHVLLPELEVFEPASLLMVLLSSALCIGTIGARMYIDTQEDAQEDAQAHPQRHR